MYKFVDWYNNWMPDKKTTIVATSKEHLVDLVNKAIASKGQKCNLNHIDVSQITNMDNLFRNYYFQGNISKWGVSNVTTMKCMFSNSKFNGDISNWDISNVQYMNAMFSCSKFNGDISKWDVARVKNMSVMFANSKFNRNISDWNVASVNDMWGMFMNSSFDGVIAKWDVSNCKKFQQIFHGSTFLGDISMWSISVDSEIEDIFDFVTAHSFKEPNVYHWLLALYDHHNFSKMQATWNEHFSEYAPMASGIFATNKAAAQLIHSQWLVRNKNLNVQPGLDFNVSEI